MNFPPAPPGLRRTREPSPADDATACTEKLERMWEKRAKRVAKLRAKPPKKRSPGLQFGLSWRFLGWRFVLAGVLLLAELSIDLLPAILLNWLVSALELPPGEGETTTAQLQLILNQLQQHDEPVPYSFYVGDAEVDLSLIHI